MNTKPKTEHSPLPWMCDRKFIRPNSDDKRKAVIANCDCSHGLGEAGETDQANAEFIVRACNNHDRLVGALCCSIRMYEHLEPQCDEDCKMDGEEPLCCDLCKETGCLKYKLKLARQALSSAKGEE